MYILTTQKHPSFLFREGYAYIRTYVDIGKWELIALNQYKGYDMIEIITGCH